MALWSLLLSIIGTILGFAFSIGLSGYTPSRQIDDLDATDGAFGWREVTGRRIYHGTETKVDCAVDTDRRDVLTFSSGVRNFDDLVKTFNEMTAHLAYVWLKGEKCANHKVLETQGN